MSIPNDIKNIGDDFKKYIDDAYDKKMQEHVTNISRKLNNEAYTENYGKITQITNLLNKTIIHNELITKKENLKHIKMSDVELRRSLKQINNDIQKLNVSKESNIDIPKLSNCYFIHVICSPNENKDMSYFIVDNYGFAYMIQQQPHIDNGWQPGAHMTHSCKCHERNRYSQSHKFMTFNFSHVERINKYDIEQHYPLSNILIDIIKTTPCNIYKNDYNSNGCFYFLSMLRLLSKHHHEIFVSHKISNDSTKIIKNNESKEHIIKQKEFDEIIDKKNQEITILKNELKRIKIISNTQKEPIEIIKLKKIINELKKNNTKTEDLYYFIYHYMTSHGII